MLRIIFVLGFVFAMSGKLALAQGAGGGASPCPATAMSTYASYGGTGSTQQQALSACWASADSPATTQVLSNATNSCANMGGSSFATEATCTCTGSDPSWSCTGRIYICCTL